MSVVPSADLVVDLDRLAMVAEATTIRLADDRELHWLYPDCKRHAMPPFVPLHHQIVYAEAGPVRSGGGESRYRRVGLPRVLSRRPTLAPRRRVPDDAGRLERRDGERMESVVTAAKKRVKS
jgi:hypothetical protein